MQSTKAASRYAVKHLTTGRFFAGFDATGAAVWANGEQNAKAYDARLHALAQAQLFRAMHVAAQLQPVRI